MKAEPLGASIAIAVIAATTANPVLYALAGSLAGAAVGASITEGTLMHRAVRLLVSLMTGFACAVGLHAFGAIYALMYAPPELLFVKQTAAVDVAVGYAIAVIAFIFATLSWPALLFIETSAPSFFKKIGARYVGSRSPNRKRPDISTARRRVAKAVDDGNQEESNP